MSLNPCPSSLYVYKKHKCNFCDYRSNYKWVVDRHMSSGKHRKKSEGGVVGENKPANNESNSLPKPPTAVSTIKPNENSNEKLQGRKRKFQETSNINPSGDEIKRSRTTQDNIESSDTSQNKTEDIRETIDLPILSKGGNILDRVKPKFSPKEDIFPEDNTKKLKPGNIVPASGGGSIFENEQFIEGPFNLQLIENFKLVIFGPSRSGKTQFLSDLLKNLEEITQEKPVDVFYIFTAWQDSLAELKTNGLVTTFLQGESDIESKLNKYLKPNVKSLVIFDDQATNKKVVEYVAHLFSIEARHKSLSVIYVSQKIFDGENVRNIRRNSDYICVFKCPQDCLDIKNLSRQMTRGGKLLQNIYEHVTKNEPYTYVFMDVTQRAVDKIKFRSHIFEEKGLIRTYVPI